MSSCVFESAFSLDGVADEEHDMMSIDIKIPTKNATSTGYEAGNYYENHIDTQNGDFRIYFFDKDNIFINRFIPMIITPNSDGNNYTKYRFQGKVPAGVVSGSTFKVVVIANWGDYEDSSMIQGTTTINDLCNASWSQFTMNEHVFSFRMKMPFFGVRQYDNYDFVVSDDELPKVLEPVDMLRGMAKVEVIFDCGESNLQKPELELVTVDRYNGNGYCAPADVFHQDAYVTADNAYSAQNAIHLVNSRNDTEHEALSFYELGAEEAGADVGETWMIYLLEYDNTNEIDDYTVINLKFKDSDNIFPIYFAEYAEGKTDNYVTKRIDIKRNTLYRYKVNGDLLVFPEFSVYVDDYTDIDGGDFDMDTQLP